MENIDLWDVPEKYDLDSFLEEIATHYFNKKEYGLTAFCSVALLSDFSKKFDRNRVRVRLSETWKNLHITSYLTAIGIEITFSPVDWEFHKDKVGIYAKERRFILENE